MTDNQNQHHKDKFKKEASSESLIGRTAKDFFLGCLALIPLAVFIFTFYYLVIFFESIAEMLFGLTKSVGTSAAISIIIIFLLIYTGRKLRLR